MTIAGLLKYIRYPTSKFTNGLRNMYLVGEDALKDRRGRKKDEEELSPEDRLRTEIKKLKADNKRLRVENARSRYF
ncbi:MAG: hypothetical protein P4L49_18250 [Desulfosporosinus sp.]|nr:hypothetical protein [Desulfosporosinus sp.]